MKQKQRKAQLQMGENVIVLVIFFFLLVIAVLFYAKIQKSSISLSVDQSKKVSSINLKTLLLSTPELRCGEQGNIIENCVDEINAKILAQYWDSIKNLNNNETAYYQNRFGRTNITIHKLNLKSKSFNETWNIYDANINLSRSSQTIRTPIILYNAVNDTYDYAEMELIVYTLK